MRASTQQFSGTGVALITPFRAGKIDFEALGGIINHCIKGGVDYLVSLGTTGEAITLSEEEQLAVIEYSKECIGGRVPLVVGIFGGSDTIGLLRRASNFDFSGIDALLCASPAYNKPSQEGIYQHYKALAVNLPLPIILYNVPSRTASNIAAGTVLRLADASEQIIGIKEASNDLAQIARIIHERPKGFLVLSGDDFHTLPIMALGGDGVISVIGNALPKAYSDLVRACGRGDYPAARAINRELLVFYHLLFSEGNPSGVKSALAHLNLCADELRLPLVPMTSVGSANLGAELLRLAKVGLV